MFEFKVFTNRKVHWGGHVETTESEAEAVIPLKNSHGENR